MIDIAVHRDTRADEKEQETNIDKYQNLAYDLKRLWKVNTNTIPTMVGDSVRYRKNTKKPRKTRRELSIELLQKAALLRTARIPRKLLDIEYCIEEAES